MLCTAEVVPPTMRKAFAAPKASAASCSASRIHGNGVAEIIQRLHGIDVHGNTLFSKKLRQLRVAAAALVAGHIEGNNAHLAEALERFINRRALLIVKLQIVPLLSKCSGR